MLLGETLSPEPAAPECRRSPTMAGDGWDRSMDTRAYCATALEEVRAGRQRLTDGRFAGLDRLQLIVLFASLVARERTAERFEAELLRLAPESARKHRTGLFEVSRVVLADWRRQVRRRTAAVSGVPEAPAIAERWSR